MQNNHYNLRQNLENLMWRSYYMHIIDEILNKPLGMILCGAENILENVEVRRVY